MPISRNVFKAISCKVLFAVLVLLSGYLQAQVLNDNIEKRRNLNLEEVAASNTNGCTVQRTCVDESLTGKCVEYHNDQWFEFTPEASGNYFVNISAQQCRDTRGVQLIVLTGKPCQPKTYSILSCASLGSQDDVFIMLEALQAKQAYLLNLDGYLNDQCQFRIAVSKTPHGLPANLTPPIISGKELSNAEVNLKWGLPDSLTAQVFRIFRREASQFQASEIALVSVNRDTYGELVREYTYTDTLPEPGNYLYQIVAYGSLEGNPVMVAQQWFRWKNKPNLPLWYNLPLENYPDGANITIIITDAATGNLLRSAEIIKRKNLPDQGKLLLNEWQAKGIKRLRVQISHYKKGKVLAVNKLSVDI